MKFLFYIFIFLLFALPNKLFPFDFFTIQLIYNNGEKIVKKLEKCYLTVQYRIEGNLEPEKPKKYYFYNSNEKKIINEFEIPMVDKSDYYTVNFFDSNEKNIYVFVYKKKENNNKVFMDICIDQTDNIEVKHYFEIDDYHFNNYLSIGLGPSLHPSGNMQPLLKMNTSISVMLRTAILKKFFASNFFRRININFVYNNPFCFIEDGEINSVEMKNYFISYSLLNNTENINYKFSPYYGFSKFSICSNTNDVNETKHLVGALLNKQVFNNNFNIYLNSYFIFPKFKHDLFNGTVGVIDLGAFIEF